jgi:RNA polymerase sigma factor (TIGR02999 family)
MATTGDVTQLLHALENGDRSGFDDLLARVYDELQTLARAQLRNERAGHTLATTDLVHEAYLRLVDSQQMSWRNRAHFFGAAARAMRRVLIDHARAKSAQKRKGEHVTLSGVGADDQPHTISIETLLAVDQALKELKATDERLVRVVECRFFAGLTIRETAEALGISHTTVSEDWRLARAWLRKALSDGEHGTSV